MSQHGAKQSTRESGKANQAARTNAASAQASPLEGLQRSAGNQAVAELFSQAAQGTGAPLDDAVRRSLEPRLGVGLGRVRVHSDRHSAAAAESIGARAYTIGADIHLGPAAASLDQTGRERLLTHEAVHAVQQGLRHERLEGVLPVSNPGDSAEREATGIASSIGSAALAMRDALRVTSVPTGIQRDIVGDKTFSTGKFEIKFKKTEGKAAGDTAQEVGDVKFTPSATAPDADFIRFIQIARTFDTTTNKEFDYSGGTEANRNKMQTQRNTPANIAPGFFVDQIAASLTPRTKKADARVSPFYDLTPPAIPENKVGKKRGKVVDTAVLHDTPGFSNPLKFSFVTVAKNSDAAGKPGPFTYGTVLWGFEVFHDKAGVAKIRDEYTSFRTFEGETFVDAVKRFDEFYKNPGTPGAPTK